MSRVLLGLFLVLFVSACTSSKTDENASIPVIFREAQKMYDEGDYLARNLNFPSSPTPAAPPNMKTMCSFFWE